MVKHRKVYKRIYTTSYAVIIMVLKNRGTFKISHKGKTGILYIPADLVKDSTFPLKEGKVTIEIVEKRLTVTQK